MTCLNGMGWNLLPKIIVPAHNHWPPNIALIGVLQVQLSCQRICHTSAQVWQERGVQGWPLHVPGEQHPLLGVVSACDFLLRTTLRLEASV